MTGRPVWRVPFARVTVLVAAVTLAWSLAVSAGARAGVSPRRVTASGLTPSQLAADLRDAEGVRTVPADLQPPLGEARSAVPAISENGCRLGRAGVWKKPCVYGDTTSRRSVVLFGDSHAGMWFPALNLISKRQHWRLIDLTKSGCPGVEVNLNAWFLNGALYSACTQWRAKAMAHIAALHPALVIVTWARWLEAPEARPTPGIPTGYGGPWEDGVAATFSFLRRAARRVIFISDVPTLPESAPVCLAQHLSDVQACTPSRSAATSFAAVKASELELARRNGIGSIDPTSWFCTETRCPVIVRNLLVYQDNSHMTREWSRFLTPVLRGAILRVMWKLP